MTPLRLLDAPTAADLATYVRRARALDAEGDVRLQAAGPVLAAWTCVLPGQGLLGAGLVLGLRTYALAEPVEPVDVTVPLAAVGDRLAHDAATLPLPPMTTSPAWAALTPPRGGWEPVGEIASDALAAVAKAGIEEVATGAPSGSGAAAVADLRRRVWGRATATEPAVPGGAAFGMHALGFLAAREEPVTVHRAGPWTRLSSRGGHVLTR